VSPADSHHIVGEASFDIQPSAGKNAFQAQTAKCPNGITDISMILKSAPLLTHQSKK